MILKKLAGNSALTLIFLFLASLTAWGQFSSSIDGTVTDPSGAVVPGATVTLTNKQTGVTQTMKASGAGYFRFASLPPSDYSVTVTAEGFKASVQENVPLQVTEVRTVNVALEVGAASTQVTVKTAPAAVQLNDSSVTNVIGGRAIHDLPVANRNLVNLLGLAPGVTGLPLAGDIFYTDTAVGMNAGGNRTDSNNFIVNGASVSSTEGGPSGQLYVMPNIDMIEDVRVQVNNFSAEYGRNAGAQVSIATKQGTNDWHGTLSEFHRDNAITSRTEFQPNLPVYRRNDFGWTFGGPIRKNRTFFFATMDLLRAANATGRPVILPTGEFINWMSQNIPDNLSTGLLTKYPSPLTPSSNLTTAGAMEGVNCATLGSPADLITVKDPVFGTPQIMGPSTASSSGQPFPQIPCNLNVLGQASFATTNPEQGSQWGLRIDHMIGDKDRIYGNYLYTHQTQIARNPFPAFDDPALVGSQLLTLDETHTFSPTLLNELSLSYVRSSGAVPTPHPDVPFTLAIGMETFNFQIGPFTFAGNQSPQVSDTLSWIHGRHSLKFGGNFVFVQGFSDWTGQSSRLAFIYLNALEFAADNAFEELVLGYNPKTGGAAGLQINTTVHQGGAFFQDDFKAKPNLTLNFGLRWEDFGNPRARDGKLTNIVLQGGDTFMDQIANAKVDVVPQLFKRGVKTNFAPRFGFAWDPTKKGKMSIRGGAGIFYDRPINNVFDNVANNLPLVSTATAFSYTPNLQSLDSVGTTETKPYGYTFPANLPLNLDAKNGIPGGNPTLFVLDPYYGTARIGNVFFGVQYALTPSWTLEADFLGSWGRHLYSHPDVNRITDSYVLNNGVLVRPNTSFGIISWGESNDTSHYTGGTVALTKRYSYGLSMQASFTVGKGIDYNSQFVGGGNNPTNMVDVTNHQRDRGLSDFDIRKKFAMTSIWDVPTPQMKSRVLNKLAKGWELSSVLVIQNGSPFSVYCGTGFVPVRTGGVLTGNNGCDYNADGFAYDYPNTPAFGNSLSGLNRTDYLKGIFKVSDFPKPGLGVEGDLGRNTFYGPGFANVDLGLIKNTRIPWFLGHEGANFQFRAEFLNAFNRVNLAGVNANLGGSFFGQSTGQYPARTIQFGARIQF